MRAASGVDILQLRILITERQHLQLIPKLRPDDKRDIEPVLSYLNDRIDELDAIVNPG